MAATENGHGYGKRKNTNGSMESASNTGQPSRASKFGVMMGNVYRAGMAAATEIREVKKQYKDSKRRGVDLPEYRISISGSFPNVAIVARGDEEMVLFPSYAKRHVRDGEQGSTQQQAGLNYEDYWRREWAQNEDMTAIVDVDVRGWVYSPHKGPLTRRNRMLIGLARRLSGIPAPAAGHAEQMSMSTPNMRESVHEEQRIAQVAQKIEKKGQCEKKEAERGGYSEAPGADFDVDMKTSEDAQRLHTRSSHSGSQCQTPSLALPSPRLATARSSRATASELSEAELAVANANLMARISPFLAAPRIQMPVTIFFYNEEQSQSRTVVTTEAGHFSVRAALDFVPTHVRVLANEDLSATEPVRIIESRGVSLISDIDDTIKSSNISLGAAEIFRNTFIRDLGDMTINGVREWYGRMHSMGVQMHYCSNSPWQLYPVIATYFNLAGIPRGSIHLKQYNGMLQGIFEPVAERKKGTLDRLMRDFPERRFLLVGDSGEADLEVYMELAAVHTARILAIFIRDVTTPEETILFDQSFSPRRGPTSLPKIRWRYEDTKGKGTVTRPALPPRLATAPPKSDGLAMRDLIDLSDSPSAKALEERGRQTETSVRSGPPPRPAKPMALRSSSVSNVTRSPTNKKIPPPTAPPRGHNLPGAAHPLSQMQNSSQNSSLSGPSEAKMANKNQRPLPPRCTNNLEDVIIPPSALQIVLPPSPKQRHHNRTSTSSSSSSGSSTGASTPTDPVSKKVELWRRRLLRAREVLDPLGIRLFTWRRGDDVALEAEEIVKEALKDEIWRKGGM